MMLYELDSQELRVAGYTYRECPHCDGLSAFPIAPGVKDKAIVYVCDWCEAEF